MTPSQLFAIDKVFHKPESYVKAVYVCHVHVYVPVTQEAGTFAKVSAPIQLLLPNTKQTPPARF